jgi:peroxiredoxin (alkyl hydroperoxide reductase subunit C)
MRLQNLKRLRRKVKSTSRLITRENGIKRILIGLQTADNFSVALPADWRPGDDVIVPTAGSCGVAKSRMEGEEGVTCYDWFFCTKKLSKEAVESKLGK